MTSEREPLSSSVASALARHGVPGVSIATLTEGRVTTAVSGVANICSGLPVTADTIMHIGSITKVLNATLIMQLVDEGRVQLDCPVEHYLPGVKLKDPEALHQITVKMLLNHTSGIDGELLPDYGHDEETIERAVARFGQLEQLFPPGTEFSYSNAATVIAGYLAQVVRGESWYELIRDRILKPLGMNHSTALPEEAILFGASVGHYVTPGSRVVKRTSRAFLPLSFAPCGTTMMSSASDLLAFAQLFMPTPLGTGFRVLSRASIRAMQTITVRNTGKGYTYGDGMGLGWMVFDNGLLHHSGGGPGIASALYVHPDTRWAMAVLTNADYGVSMELINELVRPSLKSLGIEPYGDITVPEVVPDMPAETASFVGVYQDILQRYTVVQTSEGLGLSRQLLSAPYENMSTEPTPVARLSVLGDGRFLLESGRDASNGRGEFYRVFTFRHSDGSGRTRYLGNGLRLYKRVD